jgi:hypothetical protein
MDTPARGLRFASVTLPVAILVWAKLVRLNIKMHPKKAISFLMMIVSFMVILLAGQLYLTICCLK